MTLAIFEVTNQSTVLTSMWSGVMYEFRYLLNHKEMVAGAFVAARWMHKKFAAIRPGIVRDVTEAVMVDVNSKIDAHALDDKEQFGQLKEIIRRYHEQRHKEIALALQEHVAAMHHHASN